MSGIILNVTELNSKANHKRDRQNDIGNALGEMIVENIDEKRSKKNFNDAIINTINTSDINSKRDNASATETTEKPGIKNGTIPLDHNNDDYDFEDSSVVDSDSELDSDFDDIVQTSPSHHNNGNQSTTSGIMMLDKNLDAVMLRHANATANNDIKPNIGSIAVQNSSDITFGNKTFYQGPVTIKQFVYDKNNKWKENELPTSAAAAATAAIVSENDNLGFINISTDKLSNTKMENIDRHDKLEKIWRCTNRKALFGSTVAGILICSLLALILIVKYSNSSSGRDSSALHIGDDDESRVNKPIIRTHIGSDVITDTAGPLRIVSRKEWIAQPPSGEMFPLELPVSRVIIAHTATDNCTTEAECKFQVRQMQTFHIESRGWGDIAYNFLVGGDGSIYVGRGWDTEGAHTKGFNRNSVCFAFIGTFNTIQPPKRQLVAVQKMLIEGVKLKKLTADYALYGHRQFMSTQSPGTALYEIIQKWDHWTEIKEEET